MYVMEKKAFKKAEPVIVSDDEDDIPLIEISRSRMEQATTPTESIGVGNGKGRLTSPISGPTSSFNVEMKDLPEEAIRSIRKSQEAHRVKVAEASLLKGAGPAGSKVQSRSNFI